MRLLLVTHYYAEHAGGIEIIAYELAKRLVSLGIEVVWVASSEGFVPVESPRLVDVGELNEE
jgi:hypothetical protein